jgi:hypothetical protein
MKNGTISLLDLRLMLLRQPGLLMLLAVLAALAFWLLAHPPQPQPDATELSVDPARIVAAQRNFRGVLIPPASLAVAQQAVLDMAARNQLTIGRVDYAQEADAAGRFVRATMRLPLIGRYADIRAFLDGALTGQPAMSVRDLSIQRETTTEPNLFLTATLTAQFLVGEAMR